MNPPQTTMKHTIIIETDMTGWSLEKIAKYQQGWRELAKDYDASSITMFLEEHTPACVEDGK